MASVSLQDLRRRRYVKAKADKDWRFWGLYVQVGKLETLRAAYDLAKRNNGAPGSTRFWCNCGMNWSHAPIDRCGTGGWRFRKTTGRRSAS